MTTTLYADEPIVFVTVEGNTDDTQLQEMHAEVLTACERLGVCYIVLDVRGAEATVHENLALLLSERITNLSRTGQSHIVVIGESSPNERLGNVQYPIFADKNEALTHIRQQIALRGSGNSQE